MKKTHSKKIEFFQNSIIEWFNENGRKFPWRNKSISNYKKVIAEVLLQRTKAETIAKFFPIFLKKYPNWNSINNTRLKTLEKVLQPVGLFRQRSVLLKKLAKKMVKSNGRLPKKKDEIEKLPFAGQYITNAILQFVHNKPAPLLDVNMARVLERFFGERELADIRYDPYLQKLSWKIVDHKQAKKLNWGILDFAAKICVVNNPKCSYCSIKNKCKYFKNN